MGIYFKLTKRNELREYYAYYLSAFFIIFLCGNGNYFQYTFPTIFGMFLQVNEIEYSLTKNLKYFSFVTKEQQVKSSTSTNIP